MRTCARAMLVALPLATLQTGALWRGRHPPVERAPAAPVYWGMVGLGFVSGTVLPGLKSIRYTAPEGRVGPPREERCRFW